MTKNELIDAYVRGDVDRRGFIRRLTAMGVSAAAAAAYAGSFARDAAASPVRNGAGFMARPQDDDEEYGVAVAIENIQAAIVAFTERSGALVERLRNVGNGNGNGPKPDEIATIRGQIAEQRQAVVEMLAKKHGITLPENGSDSRSFMGRTSASLQGADSASELLDVANELNIQTGIAAALIPNLTDLEERQLLTSIGLVTARHAAIMSYYAGIDPAPSAFEVAIDPATVE